MRIRYYSLALFTAALTALPGITLQASSHREAPFITENPKVDGTDFYMFRSYEPGREDFVTIVANYLPLQDPYGGPNYFFMDPEALYEIHIDEDGDAREDLTFQFRFQIKLRNQTLNIGGKDIATPLINFGPTVPGITAGLNIVETYTVKVVEDHRRHGKRMKVSNADNGDTSFLKPVDNIGNKTIADYESYAAAHQYNINIPECSVPGRMFVGQRKDPFMINLGEVFDLVNLNPLGAVNGRGDVLNDANVTSLILELPISCLVDDDPVIGAWTTASLRQGRLIKPRPSFDRPAKEGGPWVQVSRLGMPLVNEVVIGLKDKNRFNSSKPRHDAQFADYVTHPTLPALIEVLFSVGAPTNFPRNDLVMAFLTGVPGLNQPIDVKPAEMLRLNTDIPPTPKGSQNNLGVIGGDNAGFPNGRRPGDDIVDISLRVVMGKLCKLSIGCVPSDAPVGDADLTDGTFIDDSFFGGTFPYIASPLPGSPQSP